MLPDNPLTSNLTIEDLLPVLQRLADNETDTSRISFLEDAIASVRKFIDAKKSSDDSSTNDNPKMPLATSSNVVDTGLVTGPLSNLKNFLIRKQQDNEAQ